MSSLHQDRLLIEGSEPVTGTASTLPSARGTGRQTVGSSEEKPSSKVPTQRLGTAQRSGTTQTGLATRTTVATATAATAARAAADPKPVGPEHASPKKVAVAGAVRPTPYKRTPAPAATVPEMVPATDAAGLLATDSPLKAEPPHVVVEDLPGGPVREGAAARLPRFLPRRPPVLRHRPALYLAAALVGALGVGTVTAGGPKAQATDTMSHSVSVAEQLGIKGGPAAAIAQEDATQRLGELAVSRNVRADEQAAAAQVQAEADRIAAEAAAEAARPKAVLPVQGARLTSTFGPRWGTLHAGLDLAAPMRTPEYAVMDGVVLEAGPASGFGLVVYIQHGNGDVTVYGHMDEILVQAGQVVRAGDTIALLGNRGQSTGPHLHFEVHVGGIGGTKIDPLPWLRERGVAI
jgi:murein DD-endopeptidase MepM/ murein hydrolase activator NlpD